MPTINSPSRPTPADHIDGGDVGELTVTAWRDPVVEGLPGAIATCSDEALIWWTPSVGPTAMLMAHRFAAYAVEGPTTWTVPDIAATFGMGASGSRVVHTLARLERFGIVASHGSSIAVRLMLAPLTRRQRACLPGYLADALDA